MTDRPSAALDRLLAVLDEVDSELPAEIRTRTDELARALALTRRAGYVVHYGPCPSEVAVIPAARRADASTSHAAAVKALPRARSVAFAMLKAYDYAARTQVDEWAALTADEAGALAERYRPGAARGAWRRVSELERFGLIEVVDGLGVPRVREGLSGSAQRLHAITPAGRAYLERTEGVSSEVPS